MPENTAYEGFRKATEALTDALTERLTGVTARAEGVLADLQREARVHTRWIVAVVVALVASLTGLAIMGFEVVNIGHNEHQVQQIQSKISKRSQVLCPLYTVFIQSDTPQARKSTPPDQLQQRDHAFKVIRHGYMQLGCLPHLDRNGHLPPEVVGKSAPGH